MKRKAMMVKYKRPVNYLNGNNINNNNPATILESVRKSQAIPSRPLYIK